MRSAVLFMAASLLLGFNSAGMCSSNKTDSVVLVPGPAQLPDWLQQGKIHFARFDGGPIEIQKTRRSAWGERFTREQQEVLGNLYGKYGDRMVDLLTRARVNFVWVTFSVGFSWQDEAAQRAAVREITRKLHAHGIHVAAYMCAVSLFWQSMFKDVPQSVRWVMFDPQGLPYRYSGGRDALRFFADLRNPQWIDYQEKRVGAMIDDGLDAIFFDNTSADEPASDQTVANFFTQIRRFIHDQKHSSIPLFSNFGLSPSRAALNRTMNFTFDEHWQEPGVWSGHWNVSNIRRDRYLRGIIPAWKPFITEYSVFHSGDRSTSFLGPRSEKLSIAEAAAFNTVYAWDMEGPFDAALMEGNPAALASWSAIAQYNGFLDKHEPLYVGAVNVEPIAVILPQSYKINFAWDNAAPLLDRMVRRSELFDVKMANRVSAKEVDSFFGLVTPYYDALTPDQKTMILNFQKQGVAHSQTCIKVKAAGHVLANVTALARGRGLVVHLLNYDPKPVTDVSLKLCLGSKFSSLVGRRPRLVSPDQSAENLEHVRWQNNTLQATLPSIDVYSLVVLQ